MAERASSFQNETEGKSFDVTSDATSKIREDVEHFVEGIDLQTIAKRVEAFGKENPVGLAFIAASIGIAVGILMRSPKRQQV